MKNEQQAEARIQLPQRMAQQMAHPQPQRQQQKNHLSDYNSLLGEDKKVRISTLLEQLSANCIQYNAEEDHNQFYLHLLHHSNNYKTLTLKVILGPFTTIINIFNDSESSLLHELNCLYGSFGNVYLLEMGEQQIAIKCIQIKVGDRMENIMLRAIKEYTINKIASAIKVGPKVIKIQEFDIIIYQNCFEFCMQKCFLSEEYTLLHQDYQLLKIKLRMLHQLKIVHCDIKPTNIVYSRNFKSPVFLDFGFSKILSTSPGTATKTKYVGSLETCCKQMVDLYLTKQFGNIDLFYNDAFSLNVSLRLQPIRQTGNDLQEIIKYCDHSSSVHLSKIYYSLYEDKIFNATSQFVKSQNKDKRIKIMRYLATLPPTQNLRQFYFQFLYAEWGESIQFHELAINYNHSQRHHLHLGLAHHCCEPKDQQKDIFYLNFLQKLLNCKIDLFKLDNELINYSQPFVGHTDFMDNKLSQEDSYDFFLSHVGNLTENYYIKEKNWELSNNICDIFFSRIISNQSKAISYKQKLLGCFSFLGDYCLELPISEWKVRVFQRSLSQIMMLVRIDAVGLQDYLTRVIDLKCTIQKKIKLLLSVYKAYLYQVVLWGQVFNKNDEKAQKIIQKMQNYYYRLQNQNKAFERVLKLDLFLVKILLGNNNKMDFIEVVYNYLQKIKKEERQRRLQIINFLKIICLYENLLYEECRLEIEATFNTSQMPIIIKPTYILLCPVYLHLQNTTRCKQLIKAISANLMTKEIIYHNFKILAALDNTQIIESFALHKFQKDYSSILYIFYRYFRCKHLISPQLITSFYARVLAITNDEALIQCLKRLSLKMVLEDRIEFHERMISYFKCVQGRCNKQQGDKIRVDYIDKLILDKHWIKGQYQLIIQTLDKNTKLLKAGLLVQTDPQLFDYAVRAYLMMSKAEKVKPLIKWLCQKYHSCKPVRFIQLWIETTSFILLFHHVLQRGWQKFREFLLAVIDFIDVHPVKAYVNCYVQCLRYAFSQDVRLAEIDNGLSTLLFPMYQWKYPLLSFFHIEALCKMVGLNNYLNKRQLKTIMWRAASFVPFLRNSEVKWFLQQYYELALNMSSNNRYKRFLLLKCRRLMNYVGIVERKKNYRLKHLKLTNNKNIMDIIMQKNNNLQECIVEQKVTKMSNFQCFGIYFDKCKQKLKKYHLNVGNESIRTILREYKVLIKLQIQ